MFLREVPTALRMTAERGTTDVLEVNFRLEFENRGGWPVSPDPKHEGAPFLAGFARSGALFPQLLSCSRSSFPSFAKNAKDGAPRSLPTHKTKDRMQDLATDVLLRTRLCIAHTAPARM